MVRTQNLGSSFEKAFSLPQLCFFRYCTTTFLISSCLTAYVSMFDPEVCILCPPDEFEHSDCYVMERKSDCGKYNPFQEYLENQFQQQQQQNRNPPPVPAYSLMNPVGFPSLNLSPDTLSQMEPTPIADRGIQIVDHLSLPSTLANSALGIVHGGQQQDLTDWIRLLRESNESNITGSLASASAMVQQQSFQPFQQPSSAAAARPSYQPSILQHDVMDETLDFRKAESARLQNRNMTTSQSSNSQEVQIRPHQNEKWNERYLELCTFHQRFGHSVVPYHYKESSALVRQTE